MNTLYVIVIFLLTELKYMACHLKDLGEVNTNWTAALDKLEDRIVGGEPTDLKLYPFNVQFFNHGGLCSGTILTNKAVLTAAHCFDHNRNIADMTVLSNSRFIFDYKARSHEIWDFEIHERYNDSIVFSNDIAIILIHDEFKFRDTVKRGILCDSDKWMNEKEIFEATGWGEVKYKGQVSTSGLMRTHLRYIPKESCMMSNRAVLGPDMFCLYGDGERDTCQGDSGGGILWKNLIVGIVSHGNGCAVVPAMYTNVFYFRKWIRETVKKLNERFCLFHKNSSDII